MRFVFVILELSQNGPSGSRLRYAEALGRRGHDVTILTFSAVRARAVPHGVRVETIDAPITQFPDSLLGRVRAAQSLRRWFRKEAARASIDFFSSSLTGTDRIVHLAGLRNVRHWIHIATSRLIEDRHSGSRLRKRQRSFARLYHGKRVIGVSRGVLDDLAVIGAVPEEADLIYNSYDIAGLRALAAQGASLPDEPFVIHAGRFAGIKRHDLLFQAFARSGIPHRLVLLTDDSPDLRSLIEARGLAERVTVAGFQQNPYPWMRQAAALALCSDREGFPNVLVESLVVGTPVISTDCPAGPAEILAGPYARWLSPMGDAAALSENLRAVAARPYAIEPWLYGRFSLDAAIGKLEEIAARGPRPSLGMLRLLG